MPKHARKHEARVKKEKKKKREKKKEKEKFRLDSNDFGFI